MTPFKQARDHIGYAHYVSNQIFVRLHEERIKLYSQELHLRLFPQTEQEKIYTF